MGTFKSVSEVDAFYNMIMSNVLTGQGPHGTCTEYATANKAHNQYVQTSRRINGSKIICRTHRVALLQKLRLYELPATLEASHLCHNKKCMNPDHLIAETHAANKSRDTCIYYRRMNSDPTFCTDDHEGSPRCL